MTEPRRFRFAAKAVVAKSASDWRSQVQEAEALGYSCLLLDEHFNDQLSPIPALMAAADAAEHLTLGTAVLGVDFRNPVLLAREAATIDLLSDGRLELGLGAGWLNSDYAAAGLVQDSAAVRIERLSEAVDIMRAVWATKPYEFSGQHYKIGESSGYPKPHSPIPILIGGGGRKILSMAAQKADIISVNAKVVGRSVNPRTLATTTAAAIEERLGWIREAAGARLAELELHLQVYVAIVTDHHNSAVDEVASSWGLEPEVIRTSPHFQIGTIDRISDELLEMRERWGISYVGFEPAATRQIAPVVDRLTGR